MNIFNYGQTELDHLKKRDKKLGAAIDKIGLIERKVTPDTFTALVNSIISQQISTKAAVTVHTRLLNLLGEITPQALATADIHDIQKCGMTMRKAESIKGIGISSIDFANLNLLSDDDIILQLSSLKGVGVWTAEMMLIFSLQRPDVVSYGDLAIRRGMMILYNLEKLTKKDFEIYRNKYSPYGSVASLYLWALSVM